MFTAIRTTVTAIRRTIRLVLRYAGANLKAGMEYRGAFLISVFGMMLNNASFIVFWSLLFGRLGGEINGYGFTDVMFLWTLVAIGFGSAEVFLGNSPYISRIIYRGELDVYLLQPKPVLPNLLASRMSISGWGDIAFGIALYVLTQPVSVGSAALLLVFSALFAAVFVSIRVFYHSFTLFFGNAEDFAALATELPIMFSLYPGSVFSGAASVALHTFVPVAFAAYIPAEIFRSFDPVRMLLVVAADAVIVFLAWGTFRLGLRKYESGNLIGTRM